MAEHRVPANTLSNITYVCIRAKYQEQWVLAHHTQRNSWEPAGGHVESGETPLDAAVRELYEETGALDFTIAPAYDYVLYTDDGTFHNHGRTYYAKITRFGDLPACSEMDQVAAYPLDAFPENFTYDPAAIRESCVIAEQFTLGKEPLLYQNGERAK